MKQLANITDVEFGLMINAAAEILTENAESINKLNVFPVPDGDTGTNMSLSMQSGAEYERNETNTSISMLARATSKGLLMGARGNSGVILSQIFSGIAQSVEDKDVLSALDFAEALKNGAQSAYNSVMEPTEGTILTVIRMAAEAADEIAQTSTNVVEVANVAFEASKNALAQTPDMLPVLKEVGVVDSGGQGLVLILQAFYQVLSGEIQQSSLTSAPDQANFDQMTNDYDAQVDLDPNDIVYGYCTTILVEKEKGTTFDQKWDYDKFYDHLAKIGDSLLVIDDDEVAKVHIHTEDPGEVLNWGTHFGSLMTVKIDNMRDQQQAVIDRVTQEKSGNHATTNQMIEVKVEKPKIAVITVATGTGVIDLFESMGATTIISGGQTMNPSTQDFVDAIKMSGSDQVIILPNNSNIFMAAEQSVDFVEDVEIQIIKSRTIQQGLTALLNFNTTSDLDTNIELMNEGLNSVKSAEITRAIKDTKIDGKAIADGDYLSIVDGKIIATAKTIKTAAKKALEEMMDKNSEVVTVIYGEGVKKSLVDDVEAMVTKIDERVDVEIHDGRQPLYPLLISVE